MHSSDSALVGFSTKIWLEIAREAVFKLLLSPILMQTPNTLLVKKNAQLLFCLHTGYFEASVLRECGARTSQMAGLWIFLRIYFKRTPSLLDHLKMSELLLTSGFSACSILFFFLKIFFFFCDCAKFQWCNSWLSRSWSMSQCLCRQEMCHFLNLTSSDASCVLLRHFLRLRCQYWPALPIFNTVNLSILTDLYRVHINRFLKKNLLKYEDV